MRLTEDERERLLITLATDVAERSPAAAGSAADTTRGWSACIAARSPGSRALRRLRARG